MFIIENRMTCYGSSQTPKITRETTHRKAMNMYFAFGQMNSCFSNVLAIQNTKRCADIRRTATRGCVTMLAAFCLHFVISVALGLPDLTSLSIRTYLNPNKSKKVYHVSRVCGRNSKHHKIQSFDLHVRPPFLQ